jgi:hypothetical protein
LKNTNRNDNLLSRAAIGSGNFTYADANIDVNSAVATPVLSCFDNTQNKTVG